MNQPQPLIEMCYQLSRNFPISTIHMICDLLRNSYVDEITFLLNISKNIHKVESKKQITQMLTFWKEKYAYISGKELSLILLTCTHTIQLEHERVQQELVWTGPTSRSVPIRQTEQVLCNLIEKSERALIICSFVIFPSKQLLVSLEKALKKKIDIILILETEKSNPSIKFNPLKFFTKKMKEQIKFYIWPQSSRENNSSSMHAKVAIADQSTIFISSANLTDKALNQNMEMGVIIRGGNLPKAAHNHFSQLIEDQILKPI